MKIEKSRLENYLKQINCSNSINEVKLNFEENGVSSLVMNPENTMMVSAKLANSVFIKYDAIGKILIDNLSLLIKILNRFDGDITLKKEENLLRITNENRECEFVLSSEDVIEDVKKVPTIELKSVIKIDSKTILESLKNAEVVDEAFSKVKFELKEKLFIIEAGETNKIIDKHKLKDKYDNFSVNFNAGLLKNVITALEGEIELNLGKDLPMKIVKKTDDTNLFYIIAPLTSE